MSVSANGLTKVYADKPAIREITFTAEPGRITGFLGPNGAGKTTTLRCILGLAAPTAGTATVLGRPYRELARPARQVGALLDSDGLHPARTGRRHLDVAARIAGVGSERADRLLELVDLAGAAGDRVRTYSLEMRRRLALALALIGDPRVLILDEPANGLDPAGMAWLRKLLRRLADEGRTVLLSSHVLAEVAQTVDHVLVLHEGRVRAEGPVEEMTADGTLEETFLRLTGAGENGAAPARLAAASEPAKGAPSDPAEAAPAQPPAAVAAAAPATAAAPARPTPTAADAAAATAPAPARPTATAAAALRELAEAVAGERGDGAEPALAAPDAADEAAVDRALRSHAEVTRLNLVAVAGPKGGVGRTTVALLLADALADVVRLRVACVDADPATGTLGDAVGGVPAGRGLPAALERGEVATGAELAAHAVRLATGVHVFSLGPGERPSALGAAEYRRALALIGRHYDVIVCDLGAPTDSAVSALLLGQAHRVVVVSTPDRLSLDAAADTLATLEAERTVLALNRAVSPPGEIDGPPLRTLPDSPALGDRVAAERYRFDSLSDDVRVAAKRLALAVAEG
ncbi:MAG TPA: ATP-binding cassette domain-containing protein, partial [Solirubrobacteraceae bacterium]